MTATKPQPTNRPKGHDMTAPASLAALLTRRDDLTEPREWLVDETEPLEVARERIALQQALWHAVRDYETANRRLDARAAAYDRAAARRAGGVIVPTLDGDTLEAVESWLGLPHDPAAGGPPPFRYRERVAR